MEDGNDRARRAAPGRSGHRRAPEDEPVPGGDSADDVLARYGLVGGGSSSTGGRRRSAEPMPADGGGRRHRREPEEPPRAEGGRRRLPEPPAAPPARRAPRHAGPPAEPTGRRAAGTGNFLDESTARGRAALERSGALQRTQARTPGWISAGQESGGDVEATTRLLARTPRTDRDTAPSAKVPPREATRRDDRGATHRGGFHGAPPRPIRPEEDDAGRAAARIDETLTRLTAAHAGVSLISDADETTTPAPDRPRLTRARVAAIAVATVVLLGTAGGWVSRGWLGGAVTDAAALDPTSTAIRDGAAQEGATNVLVVAGERETVPGTGAGAAQTFALAHVPAGGGPVTVLSLPADLEINRPPCERYDPIGRGYAEQPVPAEARTQLVTAMTVGGPRCVTRVVQQLTGIVVTGYVGIDLDELAQLTDAVGGVPVCATRPVVDAALGPVLPQPGEHRLSGVVAADYLRASEVAGDPTSGAGPVERQQTVVAGVLGRLLSTVGLLDVGTLATARPEVGRTLTVEGLDLDQVHATARSLHKLDADGVQLVPVPTTTGPAGGTVVLRDAEAEALFGAIRTGAPLPTTIASTSNTAPGDVSVEILNASDRPGLANRIGETLRGVGFGVGETGNAPQRTPQTVIRFSPDQEAAADLLAASVPAATLVPDPGTSGVLQLVLGNAFDEEVRPPATAAPVADEAAVGSGQCA